MSARFHHVGAWRRKLAGAFCLVTLAALGSGASAQPSTAMVLYPWCAFYGRLGENCGFTTYQQCRATISGIGGYCAVNPWYNGNPSPTGSPPQIRR
jgi:hypothetical protein